MQGAAHCAQRTPCCAFACLACVSSVKVKCVASTQFKAVDDIHHFIDRGKGPAACSGVPKRAQLVHSLQSRRYA
eukprot:scaffold188314_cov20-Tisochrysis_lutea.AAC.1